jgi:AmmeMemoRadiSam system protein A
MTRSITASQGKLLIETARQAIQSELAGVPLAKIVLEDYPVALTEKGASFVTLTLDGVLRGCVGSILATDPLIIDVQQRAIAAAFQDPRFAPLKEDEYSRLKVEVSCLTEPVRLEYQTPEKLASMLRPGIDGVILSHNFRRATFLPQVWEKLPTPELFLGRLCQKMGLDPLAWKSHLIEVETYRVEKFSDDG